MAYGVFLITDHEPQRTQELVGNGIREENLQSPMGIKLQAMSKESWVSCGE